MTHPSPARASRRPLVIVAVIVAVALATGLTLLVVSSRTGSDNPSDAVLQEPVASTEAVTGPRACERAVTQALARYARVRLQGGDTNMALAIEMSRLSLLEYQTFSSVINDLDMQLADPSRQTGLADVITSVMPRVRQACQRAP